MLRPYCHHKRDSEEGICPITIEPSAFGDAVAYSDARVVHLRVRF